jgi:hypothetical protein
MLWFDLKIEKKLESNEGREEYSKRGTKCGERENFYLGKSMLEFSVPRLILMFSLLTRNQMAVQTFTFISA